MKNIAPCAVALALALFTSNTASAEDWDSTGWVKLGERSVSGRYDRDKISVGRYEGRFSKLTLLVQRSDIELLDFEITFVNGERYHPPLRHFFREGQRTRVIDLPGDDRVIRDINMRYKNLAGGGSASVSVWGWKSGDGGGGGGGGGAGGGGAGGAIGGDGDRDRDRGRDRDRDRGSSDSGWDSTGWRLLGERSVAGRYDRDTISVGAYKGRFEKLSMVVLGSDLELLDFAVKFDSGRSYRPATRHHFREGSRSRIFDLPGDDRVIRQIDLRYKNTAGGGSARVQIWAR
jgi:hypothetical protein